MIDWDKQVATELIQAGYRALTRKYHPDAGGNHHAFLKLTVTKEHLELLLDAPKYTYQQAYQEAPKRPRPRPKPGKLHIKKYAAGWYCVENVTVIKRTDRAILIENFDDPLYDDVWLPLSQLHKTANKVWMVDQTGTVVFSEWIAKQKGWL
jgi:hypothetical protein